MVGAGFAAAPQFVQLAGQPASGTDDDIAGRGGAVDRAQHLRVARQRGVGGRRRLRDHVVPICGEPARIDGPGGRRGPAREPFVQPFETGAGIGDERQGAMLHCVERGDIQLDQYRGVAEQAARGRRKIGEAGADHFLRRLYDRGRTVISDESFGPLLSFREAKRRGIFPRSDPGQILRFAQDDHTELKTEN